MGKRALYPNHCAQHVCSAPKLGATVQGRAAPQMSAMALMCATTERASDDRA